MRLAAAASVFTKTLLVALPLTTPAQPASAAASEAGPLLPHSAVGLQRPGLLARALNEATAGPRGPADMLLGQDSPAPVADGTAYTLLATDVDGDGLDEALQQRSKPGFGLALVDGATGTLRWQAPLESLYYAVHPVASPSHAGGMDLLVLYVKLPSYALWLKLVDGTSGKDTWKRALPNGWGFSYLGAARDGPSHDAVIGIWSGPAASPELKVEYRALATGLTVGTVTVAGSFNAPTASVAGDLDADGVDDLFLVEPTGVPTIGSTASIHAVTGRGAATAWSSSYAHAPADWTYLATALDATGDGVRDPVLLTIWVGEAGVVPVSGEVDTVTIVDGRGGDLAGLRPAARIGLNHIVYAAAEPGDLDGDAKQDLVFSGPRLVEGVPSADQSVVFEAVGVAGRLWERRITERTYAYDFFGAWWSDAGDLDGDGRRDAVALVGTGDGWTQEVAIQQRDGSLFWERRDLEDGLTYATGADLDGDGGADVVDRVLVSHPRFETGITFRVARGSTLSLLWTHSRTLDREGSPTAWFTAGRFGTGPARDLIAEYNLAEAHFHECLYGASGETRWTDP